MHPWIGVSCKQRVLRHAEFNKWLAENPLFRIRSGTIRKDGKVFIGYGYGYKNGEHWTTPANAEKQRERSRELQRKNRRDPEFNQQFNAYLRERYARNVSVREKNAKRTANHRREKPEMNRATAMRRYVRKWHAQHSGHDKAREAELFREATRLTEATGEEHQVDHIIPIAAGGWHHHENMQVLSMRVNVSKNDDPFWRATKPGQKDWTHVAVELWPDYLAAAYDERLYEEAILRTFQGMS